MHSQLGIEIAMIFLLVSSYWILPTCSAVEEAERAELELRVLSQPDSVGSQGAAAAGGGQGGAVAMVHIGATLRGLNSAISPDERMVCLTVNGSSVGCFEGDSPYGALVPIRDSGVARVAGVCRTATGHAVVSPPLDVDVIIPHATEVEVMNPGEYSHEEEEDEGEKQAPVQKIDNNAEFTPTPSSASPPPSHGGVSAVLLVTLEDAYRATLLMSSLRACGAMDIFQDFFVIVPGGGEGDGGDLSRIEAIFRNAQRFGADQDSITFVDERLLLPARAEGGGVMGVVEPWWSKYALQMALKLLAFSLVRTSFYLTLDADVLCTKEGLSEEDLLPGGKGNFVPEGRRVHPRWWYGAAKTLGVEEDPLGGGFGVTPAILSVAGAKLAVERLQMLHGKDDFLNRMLDGFAQVPERWWSEYTVYRTALDNFGHFDALHAVGATRLLGEDSVWYAEDFDNWNATAAFEDDPAAFIVIQSRARIDVSRVVEAIALGEEDPKKTSLFREGKTPRRTPSLRRRIVEQMALS